MTGRYKLKRPCANCPFRRGQGERFRLHPERLDEILENGGGFTCHKTVNYAADYDGDGDEPDTSESVECAGRMAVLWRDGSPDQMMRIAMRLGMLNPDELDPDGEAYESIDEIYEAHER